MEVEIKYIEPYQLGKVFGAIGIFLGIIFGFLSMIPGIAFWSLFGAELGTIYLPLIAFPVIWGIFGFVSAVIWAWVYNFIVRYTRGIKFRS